MTDRLTKTERFLNVFTEVHPGEGKTAVLMFANVFLILCAYYFIKPIREGWIAISDIQGLSKIEVKAYSSFAQAVVLLFIVGWYGHLSSRWDRATLITRSTLFCIANMVIFWLIQPGLFVKGLPVSGIIFYLWVGMFGVFIVAQFWTFCADIYNDEKGRRLLPMIAIGATAGAAFGSRFVERLVTSGLIPGEVLLLVGIVPLLISIKLTRIVDARQKQSNSSKPVTKKEPAQSSHNLSFLLNGARLVLKNRFLLAIAVLTLLNNWVNTNGENLLFYVVQNTLTEQAVAQGITEQLDIMAFTRDGTTAFYGNFFFWVNIAALVLQSIFASRLLKYGGFGLIILFLPVIALMSYSVMALVPILLVVKIMKIAENSVDYSINNTARHVVWLPADSATKFNGKPAIDTLYVRLGDGLAALTVLISVHILNITISQFIVFNITLVLLWLLSAAVLIRERKKLASVYS